MNQIVNNNQRHLDVFIKGEVIDLCIPSKAPWVIEQWYKWFNNPKVTMYLEQGIFPNTKEMQEQFYDRVMNNEERIVLLIRPKIKEYFVGVASLSFINFRKRSCHFAMVIGQQDNSPDSIFYAMEAKCRMTEHAFENVGIERIQSEQVYDLIKWQRWQILFGYQIEGILRNNYRKGLKLIDTMMSSCLLEDYLRLKELRQGSFWPGKSKMFELLKMLSTDSTIDRLQNWLAHEREQNWQFLIKSSQIV